MTGMIEATATVRPLTSAGCRLDEFIEIVEQPTHLHEYPHAFAVEQRALVYDSNVLRKAGASEGEWRRIRDEVATALLAGPGIVILKAAMEGPVVDRATGVFQQMIDEQHAAGKASGDHYAKAGANDRVWNAIEKLALLDPEAFVEYYANDMIALACLAWLGPSYQISSQINVVNPGGEAQRPHRDYHLGFLTDDVAEEYPAHVHHLSPLLTLQGAVAHCDMPVETGPTMYLPNSQKYESGYLAWRRPDFMEYFDHHRVQLPLAKGDGVFFNPALFHAAGHNRTTDVRRMANLLQVSSSLGKAMETIDHETMTNTVFPALMKRKHEGLAPELVENVVVAVADAYAFPTNLDRDPPLGGLTPPSQADFLRRALKEEWHPHQLRDELRAHAERRLTA